MTHIKELEIRNRNDFSGVLPGVFNETRDKRGVMFIERLDGDTETFRYVVAFKKLSQTEVSFDRKFGQNRVGFFGAMSAGCIF